MQALAYFKYPFHPSAASFFRILILLGPPQLLISGPLSHEHSFSRSRPFPLFSPHFLFLGACVFLGVLPFSTYGSHPHPIKHSPSRSPICPSRQFLTLEPSFPHPTFSCDPLSVVFSERSFFFKKFFPPSISFPPNCHRHVALTFVHPFPFNAFPIFLFKIP